MNTSSGAQYYLFAINTYYGTVQAYTTISGTASGQWPASVCGYVTVPDGYLTFSANNAIQRQALLQISPGGAVYVTFANFPENSMNNGWIFGYQLSGTSFTRTLQASPTPTGTGGGFWGSGAGPAADATSGPEAGSIFTATGNGTFQLNNVGPFKDYGDSLLRLSPSNGFWPPADSYTPWDVYSYVGETPPPNPQQCSTLCQCDEDLSSGGVLVVPSAYSYQCTGGNCNAVINADKQSNIYVANQSNLGGYNSAGGNNIEAVLTPCHTTNPCEPVDDYQGYWGSPAYWYDGTYNWIFYSATDNTEKDAPFPILGYELSTSSAAPPVPQSPSATSTYWDTNLPTPAVMDVGFCNYSPTSSVSSNFNGNGTVIPSSGVVWAIENPNHYNGLPPYNDCAGPDNQHAVLHAFCATTVNAPNNPCGSGSPNPDSTALTQIYTSTNNVRTAQISKPVPFLPPVISNGLVYVGTGAWETNPYAEVDVFGPCSVNGSTGCIDKP
ncbi:MAG TPA: hypothetical protein VF753_05505 [Terriglobales bacterium]